MRKVLILLGLFTLSLAIYYSLQDIRIPVFLMTEEPNVIVKGNNGQVLIIELDFEHDGLVEFIASPNSRNTLFLLDADLIERADHLVELLTTYQRATGLLGETLETVEEDIAVYENAFDNKPLWFMLKGYMYEDTLKRTLFEQQINMIAPSLVVRNNVLPKKLEKGTILSLPVYKETNVDFTQFSDWVAKQHFLSIEESLFGYSLKTKRYP
ncbi:hypothetical protein AAGS61_16275 [Lysinibacillus sp. KU-BSD001]|uniref:hypothetical protein n=1 Tax=Lysinibacillus sp. KU-BSD001 TaxID=3141328 RepID=UPI0036E83E72